MYPNSEQIDFLRQHYNFHPLHLEDVLSRRTRITIEERDGGVAAAYHVAELMGKALGWDASEMTAEVDAYVHQVRAERGEDGRPAAGEAAACPASA